jgi:hypothetical protein
MTDFSPAEMLKENVAIIIPVVLVLLGLLVFYYVKLIKAILEMLQRKVPGVLLTFSFISLIPLPVSVILGIAILIIWHYHKKDYQTG